MYSARLKKALFASAVFGIGSLLGGGIKAYAQNVPAASPQPGAAGEDTLGPAKGYLVIIGGGHVGDDVFQKFVDLAGGPNANIVFIPTAENDNQITGDIDVLANPQLLREPEGQRVIDSEYHTAQTFYDYGAKKVTILHTRDPKVADTDAFVEPLKTATGVWFNGGRQWKIADSYLNTKTQKEFFALLDRGGVIGGTSAGASIQGSYLVRGDTKGNEVVEGDHTVGLGLLKNSAIDQHFLVRNREFDLIPLITKNPDLLGISLDERTAIVVHGNAFQVLGPSYVAITDARKWDTTAGKTPNEAAKKGKIYFLRNGQTFNLLTRTAGGQGDYGAVPHVDDPIAHLPNVPSKSGSTIGSNN